MLLLTLVLLLSACAGTESYSSRIIFSGEHQLAGEVAAYGDLIILDGHVQVPSGSRVTGSVYMLNGDLTMLGEVEGDLTILGGSLTLGPGSNVAGDLNKGSSDVTIEPGSRVRGRITEGYGLPTEWARSSPSFPEQLRSSLLQIVMMILLALLMKRFLPRPLKRIELTIKDHAVISLAVGVLSAVIGLVLFIQLAFTVILIPVSIAGLGLIYLLASVGWIAIGGLLADALQPRLPANLPPRLIYLVCVSLVSIAIDALGYVPLLGAPLVLLSASVGIGSGLLTRLGFQLYTPSEDADLL
jgi:cytoskeletal protein CcmA (bactofilin family)